MPAEEYKADWWYFVQDMARYVTDAKLLSSCGGQIFCIYVFDANRRVHCCELTPSYEMHPLRYEPKHYTDDDDGLEHVQRVLDEWIGDDEVSYHWEHTVDLEKCQKIGMEPDAELDDVLEYCHGNHTAVIPEDLIKEMTDAV
jgi:hypothetical protein